MDEQSDLVDQLTDKSMNQVEVEQAESNFGALEVRTGKP